MNVRRTKGMRRAERLRAALNELLAGGHDHLDEFGLHVSRQPEGYGFSHVADAIQGLPRHAQSNSLLPAALTHVVWDGFIRSQHWNPDEEKAFRFFVLWQTKVNAFRPEPSRDAAREMAATEILRDSAQAEVVKTDHLPQTLKQCETLHHALHTRLAKAGLPPEQHTPMDASLKLFKNTVDTLRHLQELHQEGRLPRPGKGLK